MPFFPLAPPFTTFLLGHVQISNVRLFVFVLFYLRLSFFSFSYLFCCSDWPSTGLASSWKILRKHHKDIMDKFYPGVVTCSCRQFCSEFFSQISEHFLSTFQALLSWSLWMGIIRKISFFCRAWVQMIQILVKGDDVRSETRANTCHSQLWLAQESMG